MKIDSKGNRCRSEDFLCICQYIQHINLFLANAPILDPLKATQLLIFWCFQGLLNWSTCLKCVNFEFKHFLSILMMSWVSLYMVWYNRDSALQSWKIGLIEKDTDPLKKEKVFWVQCKLEFILLLIWIKSLVSITFLNFQVDDITMIHDMYDVMNDPLHRILLKMSDLFSANGKPTRTLKQQNSSQKCYVKIRPEACFSLSFSITQNKIFKVYNTNGRMMIAENNYQGIHQIKFLDRSGIFVDWELCWHL